jgi:hypothetical protein
VNPARQVAQLAEAALELLPHPGEDLPCRGLLLDLTLEQREVERGRHESLLCAVVQVALDPAPCFVGRFDEPRARGRQLAARFGVLDRI